ncbi:MAG: hypothetical protein JRG92_11995 [Deltaproteobacteria bacterium]|nr:hypothetical protein [Deltaproteobacteria bacterium]
MREAWRRNMTWLRTVGVVGLLLVGHPTIATAEKKSDAQPRAEMSQVFEAITHLLPLSLSDERWSDPANRAEIQKWLDLLASRAVALESHAEQRDAGFRNLSRGLSSDVDEIRERFRAGRYEESRFFMIEATGNCVACHSRLPSARQFPLAEQLTNQLDFSRLSAHEKTQILVATRRFSDAMDVWEAAFVDPEITPGQLDMGGYLLDYLTIGLRVERNPARVRKTLVQFRARPDLPLYLGRHVDGWVRALDATKGDLERKDRLERARQLVRTRGTDVISPLGRDQVVYDLVAASLLLQYIDAAEEPGASVAEAYYLLGLVESRSVDSYWVPQAEFHLETAIRLAPGEPFARDAYAILEEYLILGYGGASGSDLPTDVWSTLNELRRLIDEHTAPDEGEAS